MECVCKVVILMITVSCPFSRGLINCKQSCSVDEALGCQVKYIGSKCPSTTLASNPVGKPRNLSLDLFIPGDSNHQNEVGFNVSWRMPNDASASVVTGFEITLRLNGPQFAGIKNCYVMSLNTSTIGLDQLLRTVFSMECYVTNKAEGVTTVLYALPCPAKRPNTKQVVKYKEIIVPTTMSNDPCKDDPSISVTITEDVRTQLVVTLRHYQKNSQYTISVMQGSYKQASQIIQPDNKYGRWRAVFEDSKLLRPEECFEIWAILSTCSMRHDGVWAPKRKFCVPTTTTTTTTTTTAYTTLHDEMNPPERQTGEAEEVLPTSTIITVTVFSALGIILLGVVSVLFIRNRKKPCPNSAFDNGYRPVTDNPPQNNAGVNGPPPQEPEEVKHLVVVYDIGNGKSIRKFIEYLKKICPALHIYDFVDVDAVEEDFGDWFRKVSGKAVSDGGRLLIVYSDGLMKLMEASTKQMYYPGYTEKVHSGEHMSSFLSLMQNRLFFSNNSRVIEWAISLGEDFHPDFHKVLVHFSGVKLNLFERHDKQLSIHKKNASTFLKRLQVNDVDSDLLDPLLKDVLMTTQEILIRQTDPDWFINLYGNPIPIPSRGEEDPTTDSSSVDSISTGPDSSSQSDERSNSFSMKELPRGLDRSSDRCPDNVEFFPPVFLHEEDAEA